MHKTDKNIDNSINYEFSCALESHEENAPITEVYNAPTQKLHINNDIILEMNNNNAIITMYIVCLLYTSRCV